MRNNQYTERIIGANSYWRPKVGLRVRIKQMTHNHLKNAIKWWHNNSEFGSILALKDNDTRWMTNKKFAIKELFLINNQRDTEQNKRIDANRCDCWADEPGVMPCEDCQQYAELESWHSWGSK